MSGTALAAPASLIGRAEPRIFTSPLRPLEPRSQIAETRTLGYQVIDFAKDVCGIPLLPWQQWLVVHALELREDGSPRFRTVIVLVARQSGKSTLLQILALFWMYVLGRPLVIGTAQNLDIAEEVWQGAVDIAEDVPELKADIERVDKTNGKKSLRLTSGERYKVQAANRRGGRGLSGDLVLMDELREHQTWESWGAVTKTTMARANAQVWAASNAGDLSSVVLRFLRELAHEDLGDPDGLLVGQSRETEADDLGEASETLGLFEWSAEPECAITDRAGWAQANPALGHTITERAVASAARTDPEWVFRTEVLCQWAPTNLRSELSVAEWDALAGAVTLADPVVLCVDVAPGHTSAAVVATDGVSCELLEHRPGTSWLVPRLVELDAKHHPRAVAFDGTSSAPIASLVPDLENAALPLSPVTGGDWARACQSLVSVVKQQGLRHDGCPEFAAAVAGARWRKVGDGLKLSRRDSTVDITPLAGLTAGLWVATAESTSTPSVYVF